HTHTHTETYIHIEYWQTYIEDGGLGPSCDSSGAVRAVKPGAIVSVAREEQSGGVWKHADEWDFHPSSYRHLFRSHHHFPHRYRFSHLYGIISNTNYILIS
ncbi:hypothetical protein PanWU01x14_222310, partial [Parasponia andersonii]